MIRLAGVLILVACVTAASATAQAPTGQAGATLTLLARDGQRNLPYTLIDGQKMLSLADLATVFRLTVHEDPAAGGLSVGYRDQSITLGEGQAIASVEGRLVSLSGPVTRSTGGWLVPVDFVNRALALVYETALEMRPTSDLVVVGNLRVPRVVVRWDTTGSREHVVFQITPETPYSVTEEPGRLVVDFEADALDSRLSPPPGGSLSRGIRRGERPTTLVVDVTPELDAFETSDLPPLGSTRRFALELRRVESPPAAPTVAVAAPAGEAAAFLDPRPTFRLRTIVLDPGHGGEDLGAQGAGGTLEKDVTLAVARRLRRTIESRLGVRVLLTRDGDTTVRHDERAALANNNKADLFLSLHANVSSRPGVSGAQVLSVSLDEYGDEAGARPDVEPTVLPVFGGGARRVEVIEWELAQSRHLDHSSVFSRMLEEELRARVDMSPRAIQRAPFRVLVGANMPAALVELGFISNAEEEEKLSSPDHQSRLVQALFQALVRVRSYLEADAARASSAPPVAGAVEAASR